MKYLFFILLFAIYSCHSKSREEVLGDIPFSEIEVSQSELDLTKLYHSIELVAFPDTPFIGRIKDVIVNDNFVYVLDDINNDIKVYNLKLDYLFSFGKQGPGPQEYHSITNIALVDNQIVVLSHFDMAILKFTLNGEFIEKVKLNDRLLGMVALKENFVTYSNYNSIFPEKPNLIVWGLDGTPKKMGANYTVDMPSLIGYSGGIAPNYDSPSTFYFQKPLSDTLYQLDNNLHVKQVLKLKVLPNPWLGKINDPNLTNIRHEYDYITDIKSVKDNFIRFSFVKNKRLRHGMADVKTKVAYIEDSILPKGLVYFISKPAGIGSNGFHYSIPEYRWISYFPEGKPENIPSIFSDFKDKLGLENFKYLIRYKLK